MKRLFEVALGILAAIGGFVDIGDLVFTVQAGAAFGYELMWAVIVGVVGIVTYAEMSGRVATISKRPVLAVARQQLGVGLGLCTLVGSLILSLLMLAAEVGGMGLVLQLFFDASYPLLIQIGVVVIVLSVWFLPFAWIERIFGYMGLCLVVYLVAAVDLNPDFGGVAHGFVPTVPGEEVTRYAYFAVGLIAAAMVPYEVYFYSSGAIEERWEAKDLGLNRINAIVGFGLGGLLSLGLIATSAQIYYPLAIQPDLIGTVAMAAEIPLGEAGLILALVGILFAVSGAAIDTALSGAYNLAQYLGWEWGKYRKPAGAPRFTRTWVTLFGLAFLIVSTGIDPVMLTEYAVLLSVFALPLTYLPVLLMARDRTFMGSHVNGVVSNTLGWLYFGVIVIAGIAAIPLMVATNGGS
jgi:manganese transport protein